MDRLPSFSDSELVGKLKQLGSELGRTPTVVDIRKRRNEGSEFPSDRTFIRRFGSFSTAVALANFEVINDHYSRRYTEEAIFGGLTELYCDQGDIPSVVDVTRYAKKGIIPHASIIVKRYGSLMTALEKAGVYRDHSIKVISRLGASEPEKFSSEARPVHQHEQLVGWINQEKLLLSYWHIAKLFSVSGFATIPPKDGSNVSITIDCSPGRVNLSARDSFVTPATGKKELAYSLYFPLTNVLNPGHVCLRLDRPMTAQINDIVQGRITLQCPTSRVATAPVISSLIDRANRDLSQNLGLSTPDREQP